MTRERLMHETTHCNTGRFALAGVGVPTDTASTHRMATRPVVDSQHIVAVKDMPIPARVRARAAAIHERRDRF